MTNPDSSQPIDWKKELSEMSFVDEWGDLCTDGLESWVAFLLSRVEESTIERCEIFNDVNCGDMKRIYSAPAALGKGLAKP